MQEANCLWCKKFCTFPKKIIRIELKIITLGQSVNQSSNLFMLLLHLLKGFALAVLRNSLSASLKQADSAQQVQHGAAGALSSYETIQHFNDIKEHLHVVKRNIEHIIQKAPVRTLKQCIWTTCSLMGKVENPSVGWLWKNVCGFCILTILTAFLIYWSF